LKVKNPDKHLLKAKKLAIVLNFYPSYYIKYSLKRIHTLALMNISFGESQLNVH